MLLLAYKSMRLVSSDTAVTVVNNAVNSADYELSFSLELSELLAGDLGETELLGDNQLLTSGELELGAAETLEDGGNILILATDRDQDLTLLNCK